MIKDSNNLEESLAAAIEVTAKALSRRPLLTDWCIISQFHKRNQLRKGIKAKCN